MIDREKVVNVLVKRFPGAGPRDIAAAANAIVGLGPSYELVTVPDLQGFECRIHDDHFTLDDVMAGRVLMYRQLRSVQGDDG
jgi:hypothetical protein